MLLKLLITTYTIINVNHAETKQIQNNRAMFPEELRLPANNVKSKCTQI